MKDCSCEDEGGGGDELASSEEGRVGQSHQIRVQQSHQSDCVELVKQQQQLGGKMESLILNSLYLGGIVNYLRFEHLYMK